MEGRTTGDEGIWFADEEQARFRRINRLTLAFNVPLYAGLAGLLGIERELMPTTRVSRSVRRIVGWPEMLPAMSM